MTIKHVLPPPERRAFGQSRRKQVRRQEQKRWSSSDRQTDLIDALTVSTIGRVPAFELRRRRTAAVSMTRSSLVRVVEGFPVRGTAGTLSEAKVGFGALRVVEASIAGPAS